MNQNLACAAAFSAGIGNNLPLAPTGRAGGSYREKTLTSGDLAGSLAVPAVFRIRPRLTGAAFALADRLPSFQGRFLFPSQMLLP